MTSFIAPRNRSSLLPQSNLTSCRFQSFAKDTTVNSGQGSQLPSVYRHPVRLCKASLMHAAYLAQGSQEQAGDIGILMFELTARMRRSPKEAR